MVSAVPFAAGLPKGTFMIAAMPADIIQFFLIGQKILHGEQSGIGIQLWGTTI